MRIVRTSTASEFACAAADFLGDLLHRRPRSVLALPTGNTPIGLYAELVKRSQAGDASLSEARIFNLDEYCGLPSADPHSFAAYLHQRLIDPLRLAPAQVRLLRGDAADLAAECRDYDAALAACGGLDLGVLGLGTNGHIAFNEPGSSWDERTRVVQLSQSTRARPENDATIPWQIPREGVTLGIRSLLDARQILLLIAGAHKQAAKAALYRGVVDREWPVTSLLRHPSLTVIELCEAGSSP